MFKIIIIWKLFLSVKKIYIYLLFILIIVGLSKLSENVQETGVSTYEQHFLIDMLNQRLDFSRLMTGN